MNRYKRILGLGAALALVASITAATAFFTTTMTVARIGGFFTTSVAWDSATGKQPGGQVRTYLAAGTLNIGDVVYFTADNKVNKSATLANYNALAGVVVGGTTTSMFASIAAADVGSQAALVNQRVLVLKQGRTWVANDAGGTLTAGALVIPSTATAGKIMAQTTAIDSNYRSIGRLAVGGLASTTVLADVNVK